MAVETAPYIGDLNPALPPAADLLAEGDDHIRTIKAAIKATFPSINGQCTVTDEVLTALGSGLVGFAFGTSGAPSISFLTDASTGFYRAAAGKVGVAGQLVGNGTVPVGTIVDLAYAGTPPTGWLECNGALVSRSTYSDLFALIGTTWGAGDGTTTFALPNANDRFRRGRSGSRAVGVVEADQVGTHGHTATADTVADHAHTFSASMDSQGAHRHLIIKQGLVGPTNGLTNTTFLGSLGQNGNSYDYSLLGNPAEPDMTLTSLAGAHTHTISATLGNAGSHTHAVTIAANAADGTETRPKSLVVMTVIKF